MILFCRSFLFGNFFGSTRGNLSCLEVEAIGMGNGAQVLLQLGIVHADAVVGHGDGAGIGVESNANLQVGTANLDVGIGEALEVELVFGVRGVASLMIS